uniref:Homeobox domain-containing protein n=1 Tax=Nelumbo nucifera TaxID=4432 RepID=A0A822XM46_NELNU|nr:TPA_asm: hypothetical protein HUJ06_022565 [Nelumbo nucifera]
MNVYSVAVTGCEERSPEPKPRWNPKPEQIRILEAIFNSGMVNPPRDEIKRIRAQLQEYGQVGDANVFYWFQNRKSRSKHKQRHLQSAKAQTLQTIPITTAPATTAVLPSSSSSSSEKSPPRRTDKTPPMGGTNMIEASNSPTASVNQTYFHPQVDFQPEPFLFPVQPPPSFSQEFCFSELSNVVQASDSDHQLTWPCSGGLLLNDIINQGASKKDDQVKMKPTQQFNYSTISTAPVTSAIASTTTATLNQIQGVDESGGMIPAAVAKSTVFINDVAFEVAMGPLNVREAFGEDAVLVHSSGLPVITDEWGVTLQALQHGAFYYLVRAV